MHGVSQENKSRTRYTSHNLQTQVLQPIEYKVGIWKSLKEKSTNVAGLPNDSMYSVTNLNVSSRVVNKAVDNILETFSRSVERSGSRSKGYKLAQIQPIRVNKNDYKSKVLSKFLEIATLEEPLHARSYSRK